METNALTSDMLATLREKKPYPAVSITMPVHRSAPDNAQDPVRLRNLISEAETRLTADDAVDAGTRDAIMEQLRQAQGEVDLRSGMDGLVIFATPDEHQLWALPRSAPERVVLSDSYLTRNLVAAKAQQAPYWVLSLSADQASLWSGSGDRIDEHREDGFPRTAAAVEDDPQWQQRQGDTASTFTDERTRQFMRETDAAVQQVLAREKRPLYLVGLAPALALLGEAGSVGDRAQDTCVQGGLHSGPGHALHQALAPQLAAARQQTGESTAARLEEARGRRTVAGGLAEVWTAVHEGRAAMVAVEEHYQPGAGTDIGHLTPAASGTATETTEAREDIVDELVETALAKGTEVVFLTDGTLTDSNHIAAVLRY